MTTEIELGFYNRNQYPPDAVGAWQKREKGNYADRRRSLSFWYGMMKPELKKSPEYAMLQATLSLWMLMEHINAGLHGITLKSYPLPPGMWEKRVGKDQGNPLRIAPWPEAYRLPFEDDDTPPMRLLPGNGTRRNPGEDTSRPNHGRDRLRLV